MDRVSFLQDEDIVEFKAWFGERLDCPGSFNHSYVVRQGGKKWECDSLFSAYERYSWRGTFDQNRETLEHLKLELRTAVAENNSNRAATASIAVLKWGGVAGSNAKWVQNHIPTMAEILIADSRLLTHSLPSLKGLDGLHRFNAGFVKIYSLLLDDFIIYDGRVGAASSAFVRDWCRETGRATVPKYLGFPWGAPKQEQDMEEPKNRNPSSGSLYFPPLAQRKQHHALWAIRASWLLHETLEEHPSRFSHCVDPLRALEAALFMIGYDLRASEVEIAN